MLLWPLSMAVVPSQGRMALFENADAALAAGPPPVRGETSGAGAGHARPRVPPAMDEVCLPHLERGSNSPSRLPRFVAKAVQCGQSHALSPVRPLAAPVEGVEVTDQGHWRACP